VDQISRFSTYLVSIKPRYFVQKRKENPFFGKRKNKYPKIVNLTGHWTGVYEIESFSKLKHETTDGIHNFSFFIDKFLESSRNSGR
jgi:hypothetical protein